MLSSQLQFAISYLVKLESLHFFLVFVPIERLVQPVVAEFPVVRVVMKFVQHQPQSRSLGNVDSKGQEILSEIKEKG